MVCPSCRVGDHDRCPEVQRQQHDPRPLTDWEKIVRRVSKWCDCQHEERGGVNWQQMELEQRNGDNAKTEGEAEATGRDSAEEGSYATG